MEEVSISHGIDQPGKIQWCVIDVRTDLGLRNTLKPHLHLFVDCKKKLAHKFISFDSFSLEWLLIFFNNTDEQIYASCQRTVLSKEDISRAGEIL